MNPNNFQYEVLDKTGIVLAKGKIHNLTTTEGRNHALDVVFGGGSQIDPWYIGLIKASPSPVIAAGDTLASHSGWTEATDFSSARLAWTDAAASGGSKATTTASEFTANASVSVKGMFLCSASSGSSGTLWAAGTFDTQYDLTNGQTFRVSYTCNGF